ncbi:MAG: sulfatase-like hydrolase/transferase [Rickettsiales bacterium]|nr:sulfatase-like hydrolase/transferase [Rickettsiales bacterium]
MSIKKKKPNKVFHNVFDGLLILIGIFIASVFLIPYLGIFENLTPEVILYEVIFLFFVYILLLLILNRYVLALIFVLLLYLLLLIINRFIVSFYGRSINLNDFYLWFDAEYLFNYLKIYADQISFILLFGILSLCIIGLIIRKLYSRDFVVFNFKRNRFICLFMMISLGYMMIIPASTELLEGKLSKQCRHSIMCVYLPMTSLIMHASHFVNIYENIKQDLQHYKAVTPKTPVYNINNNTDVIVILNESTFDPSFVSFASNLNLEMFKNSKSLSVQVFGGATWNTQFQVLTGVDLKFFKKPVQHNPYLLFKYYRDTLPNKLKNYQYKSFVIGSVPRRFNGQGENFRNYGFNAYYDVDGIAGTRPKENYCDRDQIMFDMAQKILGEDEKQNKFVYVETMCNHGPHERNLNINNISCGDLDNDKCSMMLDYVNRLKVVNGQISSLIDYIKHRKKRTLLLYFGDHYPPFEGDMEPLLRQYNKDPYKTFYSVQSNFKINQDILKPIKASEVQNLIFSILKD